MGKAQKRKNSHWERKKENLIFKFEPGVSRAQKKDKKVFISTLSRITSLPRRWHPWLLDLRHPGSQAFW